MNIWLGIEFRSWNQVRSQEPSKRSEEQGSIWSEPIRKMKNRSEPAKQAWTGFDPENPIWPVDLTHIAARGSPTQISYFTN